MITTFILSKALPLLLKVIVGPLTYVIGRVLLNAWRTVDNLKPTPKRFAVFLIALCISAVLQATGQQMPADCTALSAGGLEDSCISVLTSTGFLTTWLTAAIGAGLAFLLHAAKKSDPTT